MHFECCRSHALIYTCWIWPMKMAALVQTMALLFAFNFDGKINKILQWGKNTADKDVLARIMNTYIPMNTYPCFGYIQNTNSSVQWYVCGKYLPESVKVKVKKGKKEKSDWGDLFIYFFTNKPSNFGVKSDMASFLFLQVQLTPVCVATVKFAVACLLHHHLGFLTAACNRIPCGKQFVIELRC